MADWANAGSGAAALLCAASVTGLSILEPCERNPLRTSGFGLGELLRIAVEEKARTVFIGLGDTATNDCGLGMACALGYKVVMRNGLEMTRDDLFAKSLPQLLEDIERIEATDETKTLNASKYIALADVSNPLYGPDGATAVFAVQKGLRKTDIPALDTAVRRFAEIVKRDIRDVDPLVPGAGAAGGLGFALKALLGAELRPGAEFILKSVLFAEKAKLADAVITGEGKIDAQTARGKVVAAVSAACSRIGIPCFALAGSADGDLGVLAASLGLQKIVATTRSDAPNNEKISKASENLHRAALRLLDNLPIS